MYSKEMMALLLDLEKEIVAGNKLREALPPVMFSLKSTYLDSGVDIKCGKCGNVIHALFGDYSKPLANKYFRCQGSAKGEEHGIFASAINLILN